MAQCSQCCDSRLGFRQCRAQPRRLQKRIHATEIDIDRIDESPVRGLVGAGALAIPGEQVMQRIDAGERSAQHRRSLAELCQGFEIADARIGRMPQRIEMSCQAEQPGAIGNSLMQIAGRRADDEAAGFIRIFLENSLVIPGGQRRQPDLQMTNRRAVQVGAMDFLELIPSDRDSLRRSVFAPDAERERAAGEAFRQGKTHRSRRICLQQPHRRQGPAIALALQRKQRIPRIR